MAHTHSHSYDLLKSGTVNDYNVTLSQDIGGAHECNAGPIHEIQCKSKCGSKKSQRNTNWITLIALLLFPLLWWQRNWTRFHILHKINTHHSHHSHHSKCFEKEFNSFEHFIHLFPLRITLWMVHLISQMHIDLVFYANAMERCHSNACRWIYYCIVLVSDQNCHIYQLSGKAFVKSEYSAQTKWKPWAAFHKSLRIISIWF